MNVCTKVATVYPAIGCSLGLLGLIRAAAASPHGTQRSPEPVHACTKVVSICPTIGRSLGSLLLLVVVLVAVLLLEVVVLGKGGWAESQQSQQE